MGSRPSETLSNRDRSIVGARAVRMRRGGPLWSPVPVHHRSTFLLFERYWALVVARPVLLVERYFTQGCQSLGDHTECNKQQYHQTSPYNRKPQLLSSQNKRSPYPLLSPSWM